MPICVIAETFGSYPGAVSSGDGRVSEYGGRPSSAMFSRAEDAAGTLCEAFEYPRPPMDDDRELGERSAVPRDLDTLLQIVRRSEVTVPAGVATAAFDRAFAQRRAGLWDGFVAGDDIDA